MCSVSENLTWESDLYNVAIVFNFITLFAFCPFYFLEIKRENRFIKYLDVNPKLPSDNASVEKSLQILTGDKKDKLVEIDRDYQRGAYCMIFIYAINAILSGIVLGLKIFGITTIPANTFANSTITGTAGSVIVPQIGEAITAIGSSAFLNCVGISQLTIGSSITDISSSAFQGCTGITGTLDIPASVFNIGSNAFSGDTGITALTLNNGLNGIGAFAFDGCVAISGNVIIPPTVAYVNAFAFRGCIGTTRFTYTSSTVVDATAFSGTDTPITIIPAIEPPTGIFGVPTTSSIYLYWTPPINTGGLAIQSYTITDASNSRAYTTSDVSYNITGLNFGVAYPFTITA
jgi:hypothetical protein